MAGFRTLAELDLEEICRRTACTFRVLLLALFLYELCSL